MSPDSSPPVSSQTDSDLQLMADAPVQTDKLHADLYMADDLDGITESLFGSGNMNYLMLQARQTDAAAAAGGFGNPDFADSAAAIDGAWGMAAQKIGSSANAYQNGQNVVAAADAGTPAANNLFGTAGKHGSDDDGMDAIGGAGSGGNIFSPGANGMPASVALAEDPANSPNPDGNDNGDDGGDDNGDNDDNGGNNGGGDNDGGGNNGGTDDNGNGDNGNNDNGGGGNNSGGTGDIDIIGDNNIGLPIVDINLDPIENIVGDIDVGVDIGFDPDDGLSVDLDTVLLDIPLIDADINLDIPILNPVIETVVNIADPLLDIVTDITQPVLDGVATTVESLVGSLLGDPPDMGGDTDLAVHTSLGIPNIDVNLDVVEDIVGDIDVGLTLEHGADGLDIGLDTVVADLPLADVDLHVDVPIVNPILTGTLDPLAGTLADITNPDTLSGLLDNPAEALPDLIETAVDGVIDTAAGALGGVADGVGTALADLGQIDNSGNDSDIAIGNGLGLPQIDVNLDYIEQITGDIDIGAGITTGEDGITVQLDLTVAGIDILNDLSLTVDVPLVTPVVDGVLDIVHGVLGEAASDDQAATGAMALLDGVTNGVETLLSGILGTGHPDSTDSGSPAWPQSDTSLLGSVTDGLGSLVSGISDGALNLPEPVSSITEGLGLLSSGSEHGGGLLSGLLNGHGGGLFG